LQLNIRLYNFSKEKAAQANLLSRFYFRQRGRSEKVHFYTSTERTENIVEENSPPTLFLKNYDA